MEKDTLLSCKKNHNNNKHKEMSNSYYRLARQAAMSQADFPTLAVYLVSHLGV